jgi:hypothetical protein
MWSEGELNKVSDFLMRYNEKIMQGKTGGMAEYTHEKA